MQQYVFGIHITKPQAKAVWRKWKQNNDGHARYKYMLRSVQPTFGLDGAIVLRWCGMYVCIERDGYAHT